MLLSELGASPAVCPTVTVQMWALPAGTELLVSVLCHAGFDATEVRGQAGSAGLPDVLSASMTAATGTPFTFVSWQEPGALL